MVNWQSILGELNVSPADLGTKAAVAPYNPVSSQVSTNTSLDTISNSMGRYQSIASSVNSFNADQFNTMREATTPGAMQLTKDTTSAIDKLVSGGLPQSVLDDISRASAETSVSGGYGGSQFASTAAATRVGLASLESIDKNIAAAGDWLAKSTAGMPAAFDMSKLMISPAQQIQIDQQNTLQQQQTQQLQNNINAAPTPQAAYALQIGAPIVGQQIAQQSYFQDMMAMNTPKPIYINGMPMSNTNKYW